MFYNEVEQISEYNELLTRLKDIQSEIKMNK